MQNHMYKTEKIFLKKLWESKISSGKIDRKSQYALVEKCFLGGFMQYLLHQKIFFGVI